MNKITFYILNPLRLDSPPDWRYDFRPELNFHNAKYIGLNEAPKKCYTQPYISLKFCSEELINQNYIYRIVADFTDRRNSVFVYSDWATG